MGDDSRRGKGGRRRRPEGTDGAGSMSVALGFHAARTALEQSPRRVERLLLARGRRDERIRRLVGLAREVGVPFQQVPKEALDRMAGGSVHQGVVARLASADLLTEAELLGRLGPASLVVVIDGVSDPRNVGAIARSLAAFGGDGLFLPGHRAASLGPGAARTAAGALELLPVARAGNLPRLLEKLADQSITPVALDPGAGSSPWEVDLTGAVALVAGGEERGIRPSVLERCPVRARLPIRPEIGSLNVAVAVGALLSEAVRQRGPGQIMNR